MPLPNDDELVWGDEMIPLNLEISGLEEAFYPDYEVYYPLYRYFTIPAEGAEFTIVGIDDEWSINGYVFGIWLFDALGRYDECDFYVDYQEYPKHPYCEGLFHVGKYCEFRYNNGGKPFSCTFKIYENGSIATRRIYIQIGGGTHLSYLTIIQAGAE